jgi:hypothetical protein
VGGEQTATAARAAVLDVGGGFMTSREVRDAGADAGFRGWQFYLAGRCGVLGPVPPDVVRAALGFFPAATVTRGWETAMGILAPAEAAERYAAACAGWGRRRLAGLPEPQAQRLADLLETVADSADPAGLPLFAGWRSRPRPPDARARVAHLAQVLREHRGGAHLAAVLACGLTPLQAVLAGAKGAANARFFGWPEPYDPPPDIVRAAHARAEALTDAIAGRAYDALPGDEQAELIDLLGRAHEASRSGAAPVQSV